MITTITPEQLHTIYQEKQVRTTILSVGPDHVIRSLREQIEFSPEAVWKMLTWRNSRGQVLTHPYGLTVCIPEGQVLITRTTLGYLTSRFAPVSWSN